MPEPKAQSIGVRQLAEWIHRRGDIHVRYERVTSAAEGLAAQRRAQQGRAGSYQAETPVSVEFSAADRAFRLQGRIDGCDTDAGLVEEYKATRADPERVHAHLGSVHWAQLALYGALLAQQQPERTCWQLVLCYCHPDHDELRCFEASWTRERLQAFLEQTLDAFRAAMAELTQHRQLRDRTLGDLPFPHRGFRPNQRALAGRVYQGLLRAEHLLLEAPTGMGKTLAVLFPAYRALASSAVQRLFYLTSRSTGQDAVQGAAEQLRSAGAMVRCVTIIAKQRACPVPGMPCNPEDCERAAGYYDRVGPAVAAVLALGVASPEALADVADQHSVCPFELSLDAARWADLTVLDYNYLFDPGVRLQRFAQAQDAAVLIDEAHQLGDRVRDMLSAALGRQQFEAALAEAAPVELKRQLRSLRRSFALAVRGPAQDAAYELPWPEAFCRRAAELTPQIGALLEATQGGAATEALYFALLRWVRALDTLQRDSTAVVFEPADQTLTLLPLDPGPHIQATLKRYGPSVRFSGTLSPLPLYHRLQGGGSAELARGLPATDEQRLGVFVVPDLPVYLRQRQQSLPDLVTLVEQLIDSRPGNYFVALPSFSYLSAFATAFAERRPEHSLYSQSPKADAMDRDAFIAHFRSGAAPSLGCVVLGGVFTESVDFAGDALLGMVVVGVALPPPSVQRAALAAYHGAASDGEDVAYRQPGMAKVVQAAGRVVRGGTDRGVVCLVDPRFNQTAFRRFQPGHWQPRTVSKTHLKAALDAFWAQPALA